MKKIIVNKGDRFNLWTVIEELERVSNKRSFKCICDCGKIKNVCFQNIKSGKSKSCGCERIKELKLRNYKHGNNSRLNVSTEYTSWYSMKYRCLNTKSKDYKNYGGRGIKICDRWLNSFENFLQDMGERPEGKTIDRIDVDGNYEPTNCRWADWNTQQNNRRNNKIKYAATEIRCK